MKNWFGEMSTAEEAIVLILTKVRLEINSSFSMVSQAIYQRDKLGGNLKLPPNFPEPMATFADCIYLQTTDKKTEEMTLDAHQHFWRYDPVRDAWIDDNMSILKRDFLPHDLKPLLDENGIDGCIAVQADQSETETLFLLQLAESHDFIKSVVGWVDLQADNIEERLAYFSQFNKLVGFRHIVQAEKDPAFLRRQNFCQGIEALERHHFTYDILIYPHQLEAVLEFVRQFPSQLFVIDHLAKPLIKSGFFHEWAIVMQEIARHENVYCKISGMATEANWTRWKHDDFLPYLDLVSQTFGVKRLMFGSDYPVCLLAGSYRQIANIARQYFQSFSPGEQSFVFGETARQFYNIND